MIVEALLLFTVLIFVVVLLHRKPNDLPPGEWGLPIIGYLPAMGERPTDIFKRLRTKHGNILCVKMGSRLFVLLSDFSTIKSALSKAEFSNRPEFFSVKLLTYFRNAGLTMSNDSTWSTNRKFALRVLTHFGMGKSKLEEKINVEVNSLIKDLRRDVNKPVKIAWNLNVAILNVIWGLAAGKRFNQNDSDLHKFSKMIQESFASFNVMSACLDIFPWLVPIMPKILLNLTQINIMERNRDYLMKLVDVIIKEHIEKFDRNKIQNYIDMYLLEMEVQKGDLNSLSEENWFQLRASVLDLFATGSETTSTSIRWYILYMVKHPVIQEKIQKEIHLNVPQDRFPSLEDKDSLPYFEASIYESLRISSVATTAPHVTTEDFHLDGYKIPEGTVIAPDLEGCHRNAAYWERPNDFYPEHFIDENEKFYIRQVGFLPFSQGRRQCLGESLVKMEIFLFLGAIMQNFTICEPEGQDLSLNPDPSFLLLNAPLPYEVILKATF